MGLPHCGDIYMYVCEALRGGAGGGVAVRAKEGRGQISALSSSIPDFCPPDDNSRSVNSPCGPHPNNRKISLSVNIPLKSEVKLW